MAGKRYRHEHNRFPRSTRATSPRRAASQARAGNSVASSTKSRRDTARLQEPVVAGQERHARFGTQCPRRGYCVRPRVRQPKKRYYSRPRDMCASFSVFTASVGRRRSAWLLVAFVGRIWAVLRAAAHLSRHPLAKPLGRRLGGIAAACVFRHNLARTEVSEIPAVIPIGTSHIRCGGRSAPHSASLCS